MLADSYITARIPSDTKERFAAVARHQGVSESVLLRRLVDGALMTTASVRIPSIEPIEPIPLSGKVSVRLRPDDLALLRERAGARAMPTGTYVALLVRTHLRNVPPLPTEELKALKRSIAEVGAIGRNLNQIARSLNQGETGVAPGKADLQLLLRALTGLRDHTKTLIAANVASWEVGYEKASH